MKVIYCEFHQSLARNSESRCDWSMARGDDFYGGAPCRMVPMRLIPDNALVTIITALDSDHSWYRCTGKHDPPLAAVLILAALDGEMP